MKRYAAEVFFAYGHINVRATHRSTLEITKEETLTPRGTCIVAVRSEKGLADFSEEFKELARSANSKIKLTIRTPSGAEEVIEGRGDPALTYEDPLRIIVRKSTYVAPNTLMVAANKAAVDLSRAIVEELRTGVKVLVKVEVWRTC